MVEGGCQGTLRAEMRATGERAHSARSWMGSNAIHSAGGILDILRAYQPRQPVVDGLAFHEGLNAVGIRGGIAGNVIPDECVVEVNYRFAPDRSADQAAAHVREVFAGWDVAITDVGERRPARPRPARPRPRSSRPWAVRRGPSWAGPTWPGSTRSESRRSTTVQATRGSRTPSTST